MQKLSDEILQLNHQTVRADMEQRLHDSLQPSLLQLEDISHFHSGHNKTTKKYGNTHFNLMIVSDTFNNLSRVARQRKIYSALGDLFDTTYLHALSIKAFTKDEMPAD